MEPLICFFLPETSNNITANDIKTGQLRLSVKVNSWFPQHDALVNIRFKDQKKQVNFKKRIGKSDILYVGKDFMDVMRVTPKTRLKVTRVTSSEFIIQNGEFIFPIEETDNITYSQLKELKVKYWKSLVNNPFPKPPQSGSAIEMIHYLKRKVQGTVHSIGPYTDLSVFEAANRIASDLVIINGVLQLIEKGLEPNDSKIIIRLGNRHEVRKGDFTINNKEGEAFNVASSFYKVKLRLTNKKWSAGGLAYIFVNSEVAEDGIDTKIIKVTKWDKP